MPNRVFNTLLIINILTISLNLSSAQEIKNSVKEMQMKIGGIPYIISCESDGPQKEQQNFLRLRVSEGELKISTEDGEISLQFFNNRNPEITGDTEKYSIVMRGDDGKLIFTNDQAEQKQMSELVNSGSLDEEDQNFQLDGATLFIGGQKFSDQKIVEPKYCIQFDRTIKLFCADERGEPVEEIEPIVPKHPSPWRRSALVGIGLHPNSQGGKNLEVGLPWKRDEIVQMDEYLNMNKAGKEKLINSLKCSDLWQFIINFHGLQFSGSINNDLIELLAYKLGNEASLEDIESFLKEVGFFPEDLDIAVRDELLRIIPEFYKSFVIQDNKLISEEKANEEKLNENIVIREYWYGPTVDIEFYDVKKKKIIQKFQNLNDVFPLNDYTVAMTYWDDNRVAIKYWKNSIELYDIEKKEIIREFKKAYEVLRLNDHTVAVRYLDRTVELYDLKDREEAIKKFKNVSRVLRLNDNIVAMTYWDDNIELYDLETKKIGWKKKIKFFLGMKLLGKELVLIEEYSTIKVFNWKKDKLLCEESRCNPFVRAIGNNIWIVGENERLRRFGPDLSLKKLNAKQLLLFILSKRSGRHSIEINNAIWESIDSELQDKLFGKSILTKLKSYLRNHYVVFSSIGIISLASYFYI